MRWRMLIAAWLACVAGPGGALQAQQATVYGYDLRNQPVFSLASSSDQAVVLLFLATDCPISNRYVPEIQRLEKEFAAQPVVFWLVYPNATETVSGILEHEKRYGLGGLTLVRPSPVLIAAARPAVTPEAAVLISRDEKDFRGVYVGRLDDRYMDIGRERPRATRHDLELAISAVLAHGPVPAAGGPPVGCGIISDAALGRR